MYLSDCGTRLTLRGVPWTEPLLEEAAAAFSSALGTVGGLAAVEDRSHALLQAFSCMLRDLLGPLPPEQPLLRTVSRATAESGLVLVVGEAVAVDLGHGLEKNDSSLRWQLSVADEGERSGTSMRRSDSAVAPPTVDATLVAAPRASVSTTHLSPHPTAAAVADEAPPMNRVVIRALRSGTASLCCRPVYPGEAARGVGLPPSSGGSVALFPITVYPAGVSPTLAAVLDAAAPLPAASPAAEALRLLESASSEGGPFSSGALQLLSSLTAVLKPEEAAAAANAAVQQAESGAPSGGRSSALLLHDCVAAIAEAVQLQSNSEALDHVASTPEVTLEALVAHPYFSPGALGIESHPSEREGNESAWLRAVSEDYALYAFPLLHASATRH